MCVCKLRKPHATSIKPTPHTQHTTAGHTDLASVLKKKEKNVIASTISCCPRIIQQQCMFTDIGYHQAYLLGGGCEAGGRGRGRRGIVVTCCCGGRCQYLVVIKSGVQFTLAQLGTRRIANTQAPHTPRGQVWLLSYYIIHYHMQRNFIDPGR